MDLPTLWYTRSGWTNNIPRTSARFIYSKNTSFKHVHLVRSICRYFTSYTLWTCLFLFGLWLAVTFMSLVIPGLSPTDPGSSQAVPVCLLVSLFCPWLSLVCSYFFCSVPGCLCSVLGLTWSVLGCAFFLLVSLFCPWLSLVSSLVFPIFSLVFFGVSFLIQQYFLSYFFFASY